MRRGVRFLCYVDHAEAYAASVPKRPVAAFTGNPFPEHVTRHLETQAAAAGFKSPYWISKAQVRAHKVPLRSGAQGVSVCMELAGTSPTDVYHLESIIPEDAIAFVNEFPIPDPLAGRVGERPPEKDSSGQPAAHWLYRDRWRRISNAAAANAMNSFASHNRWPSKFWIVASVAEIAGLRCIDGATSIPIYEVAPTIFFNAEQSTFAPERFAPPYRALSPAGSATKTAAADSGLDVTEVSRLAMKLQRDQNWRREAFLNERSSTTGPRRKGPVADGTAGF